MADANVVEIIVRAKDDSGPGFAKSKASAADAAAGMDEYAAAVDRAAGAESAFRAAQEQAQAAAERLAELQHSETASAEELAAAQNRLTEATLASMDAQLKLAAADMQVAEASRVQGAATETAATKSTAAGGAMAGMGAKAKMALLGVAVGMGLAVKGAADFQQQTVKLTTSAGETTAALASVQQGILSLSASTATSTEQLNAGMYMVESAGFHGAAGLLVLKAAAQGAKAEGADLNEVANAVTSGLNAYGMKASQAASFTDQMVAAVGAGKMTMQDLAGALAAVLPIAASAHISFAQVGGAIATMTAQGMSAQQASQDLAFAIRGLLAPNAVAVKEMSAFGVSSVDVATHLGQRGLTGTIGMLADAVSRKMGPAGTAIISTFNQSRAAAQDADTMLRALPASIQGIARAYLDGTVTQKQWTAATKGMPAIVANQAKEFATTAKSAHAFNDLLRAGSPAAQTFAQALSKMTGGATGLNVALMLTGSHAATFNANVQAVGAGAKNAGADVAGWNDITKETSFQMSKAGDSIKAAGISLGMTLLPAVNAVLGPLSSMLAAIAGNKAASIALAVVIGALLAGAIGGKLAGALRNEESAIRQVGSGIAWLVGKLVAMTAAQEAQTVATEAGTVAQTELDAAEAANPIGLIILAIVALIVGIVELVKHWKLVARVASEAFHAVVHAISIVVDWVKEHWPLLLAILVGPIGLAVLAIVHYWHDITRGISIVIDWIKDHWKVILMWLVDPVGMAVHMILTHTHQIAQAFDALRHDVAAILAAARHDIAAFADWVPHAIRAAFDTVRHDVAAAWDWIRHATAAATDAVRHAIASAWDWLRHATAATMDAVVKFFMALPGRILSFLAALPGEMMSAGKNIILGLVHGIESAASQIPSIMKGLANDVVSYFTNPLKIFSPSQVMAEKSEHVPGGVAAGILRGLPKVAQAMSRVAGTVAGTGIGASGYGGLGPGGAQRLELVLAGGDEPILRAFRQAIRVRGGNVQLVLGAN